ncbi:MAG TPA: class I SAM-dependent methyltransferase [Pyrinomonadaceae bacterium]
MKKHVTYPGKDLEAMTFAARYHRWILSEFRPYIGKRIVEVGAGTGSFSKMLLETQPEALFLVEPSAMYEQLVRNVPSDDKDISVRHIHALFETAASEIRSEGRPDTITYVNVLEHIEDDVRELELIYETLPDGGRCLIFVPAVRALLSDFDRRLGHFRRYGKAELEKKVREAGFRILKSKNFDAAGVLPWFIKYRLLGSMALEPLAVRLYDDLVVPIASRFEPRLPVPIGKNILLVGEK